MVYMAGVKKHLSEADGCCFKVRAKKLWCTEIPAHIGVSFAVRCPTRALAAWVAA